MRRSFVSLLVGIAMAIMAVFLIGRYKDTVSTAVPGASAVVDVAQVVVASQNLPFGMKILRDHLVYKPWPKDSVPEGAFMEMDELLKNEDGTEGERVVVRQIFAGELLLKQKVSGFGTKPTLSRKVAEDMRAFSISINDVSGVAGFLLPGDKVDVMLIREGGSGLVNDIILQNVTILGIDQLIDEGTGKPILARTATVEVDSDQAQKLALAQKIGSLSLTLRNYADSKQVTSGRVGVADLAVDGQKKGDSTGGTIVKVRRGMEVDYTRMP